MDYDSQSPLDIRRQEIFLEALDMVDPSQRDEYLAKACGDNNLLRQSVEELLAETSQLGGFMERPALAAASNSEQGDSFSEKPGDKIGNYRLIKKLGEGGCGVVYMAEQEEPFKREVAIKIVKFGMNTLQVMARFELERQALALMDHPNIAKVFDAGASSSGRPYFVMELVRGVKLTDYCEQENLSPRQRLQLFVQVCYAIQHAHQKGIIHRDIKPSNIIVTSQDDKPIPKVIDFGIAKATIGPRKIPTNPLTDLPQQIGTPAYMSPEQADGGGADVDTRTDVYSLGILLHELLTGTPPKTFPHNINSEHEDARISRLEASFIKPYDPENDLAWIVSKATQPDRVLRYPTAAALAQDVEAYLSHDLVWAHPPGRIYHLKKLVSRNRGEFLAAMGIALALLLGTSASLWQAFRATHAEAQARNAERVEVRLRRQAEDEREHARLNEYTADINLAQQSLDAGNYGRAIRLLAKHQPKANEQDHRGFEWRYLWKIAQGAPHRSLPNQGGSVIWMACSPSGHYLVVGLFNKVNLWNLDTQTLIRSFDQPASGGGILADDKTLVLDSNGDIWLINMNTWEPHVFTKASPPSVLSSDGTLLAAGTEYGITLWDTSTWQTLIQLDGVMLPLAISHDKKLLAGASENELGVWNLSTGKTICDLNSRYSMARMLPNRNGIHFTFSADNTTLISLPAWSKPGGAFELNRWKLDSSLSPVATDETLKKAQHAGPVTWISTSPDGNIIATASNDHSIRLWNAHADQLMTVLHGHLSEVWTLAFTPDGHHLISGAKDGAINLWTIPPPPARDVITMAGTPLAFSKDGQKLSVLDWDTGTIRFIDTKTWVVEKELSMDFAPFGHFANTPISLDFRWTARSLPDGMVEMHDLKTDEFTTFKVADQPFFVLALAPDGRQLVTGGFYEPLRLWNVKAQTNLTLSTKSSAAQFSPDGNILAFIRDQDKVDLIDTHTLSVKTQLISKSSLGSVIAFSLDGSLLAAASNPFDPEQSIQIWNLKTGRYLGQCIGHKQGISKLAFSADGKTLASTSDDNTLKLWRIETQQELLSLSDDGIGHDNLLFSPDGKWLIASRRTRQNTLRLFSAPFSTSDEAPHSTDSIPMPIRNPVSMPDIKNGEFTPSGI